ncbi:MAG: enoyl-CoA hydratase/isomerase family protein [Alphaproteobacteria bacterium]|nr:enoyl-CoA hydratase/isomerase family protein [Alphaproteobacteria bacterium]
MTETIRTRIQDRVGIITFDRPDVLNAMNRQLKREASETIAAWSRDDGVLAIVAHGAGRAFSAGFDMKESATRSLTSVTDWRLALQESFDFIIQFWDCPKPTIAAVHGFCLGGAFELTLACDIAVAARGTRFGEPEPRFGSGVICMLLPWVTTPKFAREIAFTGTDRIDADRALAMGLVNRVVEPGEELDAALAIAADIAAAAPAAVQMTKRAMNRSYDAAGLRVALAQALDADVMIEASGGPERMEFNRIRRESGLKAALAWRDARFGGS